MDFIRLKSRAKINLSIDVLGKRQDGYHFVEMIMQTIDLYDIVKIKELDEDEIKVKSTSLDIPLDEDNIVYKAAKILKNKFYIKKGVEILVSYNVIVVDFNIFKEKYCEKYFDFKLIFNNFLKEKDAIKNKKNVSRLFDIKPSIDKLSRSIYRDCFNIHMAVIDALLEYNVKDVESYIDIECIKQANALFNNYKDGFISKPDSARIVQKIIMANPYRKDVYEYLIKEDGDFGGEIERLTKYLGYDIRPFKDYLMDVYIQELVQGDITNLELSKEKVSKYAKYIGCDNASLYITRIDAIHTFENA